jgi:hypothetical protein
VPGYEANQRYGVGAPKDTPAEIVERLNVEINSGLGDKRYRRALQTLPAWQCQRRPTECGTFIAAEIKK